MKTLKIDHINIVAQDIERTVEFYTTVLKFSIIARFQLDGAWFSQITGKANNSAKCVFLQYPETDLRIELLEFEGEKPPAPRSSLFEFGMRHFAIEVDDIVAFRKVLLERNVHCLSDIAQVPFEILPQGKRLFYFEAPDNVIVEVAQYGK